MKKIGGYTTPVVDYACDVPSAKSGEGSMSKMVEGATAAAQTSIKTVDTANVEGGGPGSHGFGVGGKK